MYTTDTGSKVGTKEEIRALHHIGYTQYEEDRRASHMEDGRGMLYGSIQAPGGLKQKDPNILRALQYALAKRAPNFGNPCMEAVLSLCYRPYTGLCLYAS